MKRKILNWNDCSVEQFQEVQEIISQDLTPTDFVLEVGDVFFELDEDITDKELHDVKQSISFIAKPIVCALNDKNLKPFNKLTIAKFIDLDVTLVVNSFNDALAKVGAILYGLTEDEVLKLPVTDIYKAVTNYIQYRTEVYKKYPNLFDVGDDEEEEDDIEEGASTKPTDPATIWMRTIFGLTQGDITKYTHTMTLSHILVFNWVSLSESLKSKKTKGI